jgi:hypothetical protein
MRDSSAFISVSLNSMLVIFRTMESRATKWFCQFRTKSSFNCFAFSRSGRLGKSPAYGAAEYSFVGQGPEFATCLKWPTEFGVRVPTGLARARHTLQKTSSCKSFGSWPYRMTNSAGDINCLLYGSLALRIKQVCFNPVLFGIADGGLSKQRLQVIWRSAEVSGCLADWFNGMEK